VIAPATAPALVFVADLDAPVLDRADRHHLERALRLRAGTVVAASDGSGRWRPVRLGAELEPVGDVVTEATPRPALAVGFALVKGDRNELVVQKLTELGIDTIVPVRTLRGVVRWDDDRASSHAERLNRVAREAAMQCRRTALPTVEPVLGVADALARPGAVLAVPGGRPLRPRDTFVLVGPEGGWAPDELALAPSGTGEPDALGGSVGIGLGPFVLRTETAAIAAGALLAARRAGLN
jgi:16S rRNA (uracil1498-N3)-methyltransferase